MAYKTIGIETDFARIDFALMLIWSDVQLGAIGGQAGVEMSGDAWRQIAAGGCRAKQTCMRRLVE